MSKRKGLAAISQETGESYEYTLEERMADIFTEQFNKFCATGMDTDEELTKWLYIQYLDVLGLNPLKDVQEEMVFFRSSSTGSCLREQTMKVIDFMEGTKRADKRGLKQPHQTRWTALGTAIGDIMQFFVLLMEKHYERLVGEPFAFRFERDEVGHPMFEQFTTTYKAFKSGNMQWATGGSVDGIMIFTDPEDGKEYRVGLEIKSKQTSAARTSHYSMKEPDKKHVWQVKNYAMLHDLDSYLIVYFNASHKTWEYTPEEYAKTPDFRVFGIHVTEEDKKAVRERFWTAVECAYAGTYPELDLSAWTFNDYKVACATSLTHKELDRLDAIAVGKFQEQALQQIYDIREQYL